MFKEVLFDWFKGTGGGSGAATMFEGWSQEKLEYFGIDNDTYDHTDVANRPAIMIESYGKQKVPFLTVIFLWDKMSDFLLSSKHDPLHLGTGEPGMYDPTDTSVITNVDSISTVSTSPKKGKKKRMFNNVDSVMGDTMKSVVDLCEVISKGNKVVEKTEPKTSDYLVENLSMDDLYKLIEQHKLHLLFLKENDLCSDGKRDEIVAKIEGVFDIISKRTNDSVKKPVSK